MATSLLGITSSALTANQSMLQIIGNNIANVNTEGYSRQQGTLSAIPGQRTGSGYFGKGVEVLTVRRMYDEFLTRQATTSKAVAASDATRSAYMQQLESLFPGGESGLGAMIGNLFNSFADIANAPTDLTARSVVLARAEEMANRFRSTSEALNELRIGVTAQLRASVDAVNTLAQQIANVNREISLAIGSGHTPNDLLDKRDQLIRDLNRYVQTTNLPVDNGMISVFVAGSQPLVLASTASPVSLMNDEFNDPAQWKLGITFSGLERELDLSLLGGGEIPGLLRFFTQDLVHAENLLGRMALAIGTAMNDQQALGLDMDSGPGEPLFNMAAVRQAYAAKTNEGALTSLKVGLDTNNAGFHTSLGDMQASNYEIVFTGTDAGPPITATAYIVRLSDGKRENVTFIDRDDDGDPDTEGDGTNDNLLELTYDGLRLSFDPANLPDPGDRFVLTPFADAARAVTVAFKSPKELAMASPIAAEAGEDNKGALTLQGLAATSVPLPANVDTAPAVTVRFLAPGLYIRSDDAQYAIFDTMLTAGETADSDADGVSDLEEFYTAISALDPKSATFAADFAALMADPALADMNTAATGAAGFTSFADMAFETYAYTPASAITSDGRNTDPVGPPPGTPFDPDTEWGWSLVLKGAAAPGDTFTVGKHPYPLLDAGNAQAMMDLRDVKMFDGGPLTDGYASLMADIGTKTLAAKQAAVVSEHIAVSLEQDRQAVAGVNLDEEAARLLQFQQAYQAAGKAMQVAQTLFDTLIGAIRI